MARIETDPNYTAPTFARATAGTDLFKKEDVQALAAAVSTHDHSTGKGVALTAGAIPNGTITSAMIADGTIVAGDIADGAITSAKILDGTIATADHADASVTNAKLASDTARANLLVNGGFEIWQRGTGPFSAASTYSVDRWVVYAPGGTTSVSRDSANADLAAGASYCAAITTVTPSATIGNGFYQVIDSNTDFMAIRGRQLSVSVRVKCSQANSVRVGLEGDKVNAGPSVWSAYHSGGGVYQTLTATITLGVVNGLTIWITGVVAGTFYVDNAMLVVGSVPADYAPLHPADDLARCLRYYELVGPANSGSLGVGSGLCVSTSASWHSLRFSARKPVVPTVTFTGSQLIQYGGGGTAAIATPSASGVSMDGCFLVSAGVSGSPLAVGQTVNWICNVAVSINIESNP
jgi:hypothetical protein